MPFVVIVERALKGVEPVGTFPHEEDAKQWANANVNPKGPGFQVPHIWRTAQLVDPKDYQP